MKFNLNKLKTSLYRMVLIHRHDFVL